MPDKNNSHPNKPSIYQRFVKANREHPIIMNIIYMIIVAIVLVWLLLIFISSWTRHGEEATVPPLKGQTIDLASMTLENDGFTWEVMDSVFESTYRPGTVVEQNPAAGSRVKPGRTVYLTVVAFTPKMVTVPDYMNVSQRQGRSMFEGLGLKVNIVTVASEYKDLVLGAKLNGVPLRPGQRIPVTSSITLEVGEGNMAVDDAIEKLLTDDYGNDPTVDDDPTVQMLLHD